MRIALLALWVFSLPMAAEATHTLGGEFRYSHLQGLTYTVEFHYWTCLESPADRPELIIDFGDGTLDTVPRTSIVDNPTGPGCCGVRHSVYASTHTYPGTGIYTLTTEDPYRSGGIVNIPNSNSQPFCVSTKLIISTAGPNNSMVFGAGPMALDYIWSTLVHDPMALDPDGDSLSFEFTTPLGLGCTSIAGYTFPTSQTPGWTWLDPATGSYHWHLPQMIGTFVIAISAREWRMVGGQWYVVGEVVRDMTICVNTLPTGLGSFMNTTGTMLRPTLCDGTLWVTNPGHIVQHMSILDAAGRQVHQFLAPIGEHPIQLAHLASGIYLLRDQQGVVSRFVRE